MDLGAGREAAKGYPGGCGKRPLAGEEHLSRAHIQGDKGEKTGGRLGGLVRDPGY